MYFSLLHFTIYSAIMRIAEIYYYRRNGLQTRSSFVSQEIIFNDADACSDWQNRRNKIEQT